VIRVAGANPRCGARIHVNHDHAVTFRFTGAPPPLHRRGRWGPGGGEAVLTLRAIISNGDFEEYWSYHLAREHQRLYPGTKQGKYALGA
jgi:hypothetical protein